MVILGGGHVPTEKAFFDEIGLRDALKSWDGIVMGISAGSMNCADIVYAQPEMPGEAYRIADGQIRKVCEYGEVLKLA